MVKRAQTVSEDPHRRERKFIIKIIANDEYFFFVTSIYQLWSQAFLDSEIYNQGVKICEYPQSLNIGIVDICRIITP